MIFFYGKMRQYRWVCLLLGLIGGCGPAVVLDSPEQFPEKWLGRKLYATPHAYIYASNSFAAREADREVARAAEYFSEKTCAAPSKGLIIVTGSWDELIDPNLVLLYDLVLSREEPFGERPELSLDEVLTRFQRREEELAKIGVDFATMFKQFAIPLDKDTLVNRFGFPPEALDEVDWAVGISTIAAMRQAYREERREVEYGVNLFYMLMVLPLNIPAEIWIMEDLVGNRAGLLFEQLVLSDPQWTMDERIELMDAYATRFIPF